MAVGPGDREVARAADVVESIEAHEPAIDAILLVDDAPEERDLLAALGGAHRSLMVTANPRYGRGDGLWGGLAAGMLHGYGWLHREVRPDIVVKLDTDALVVAPFAERIARALEDERIGMIGTALHHCDGSDRPLDRWDWHVRRHRLLVRPWRRDGVKGSPLVLRHTLTGPAALLRRRIVAARRNGYRYGRHCLGGAYAVPGRFLDRMGARGWFDDWPVWVDLDIGEDVCIGLYVHAVGLGLADANRPGDVFGVEYQTLPGTPQEVVDRGYAIIHTVKDQDDYDEATIRAFFAARRPSR
jgi:hypothetical protein